MTLYNTIIAFFTIALLSVAFKDNPIYKLVEHLYVGLYAGYVVILAWFQYGKPTLMVNIIQKGQWIYVLPLVLGLMMYTRYIKSVAWLSRYTFSFVLGVGAGYVLTKDFKPLFITQITATFKPLWVSGNMLATFNNWVLITGVIGSLTYFFFTAEKKGLLGATGSYGKWIMMIAFGSAFGNTVMARVSLFLGRIQFLLSDWLQIVK